MSQARRTELNWLNLHASPRRMDSIRREIKKRAKVRKFLGILENLKTEMRRLRVRKPNEGVPRAFHKALTQAHRR